MSEVVLNVSTSGSTSDTLLGRVRQRDPDAWGRFADLYSPLVYGWARQAGLQETDAADVAQNVFRTVFAKIGDFQNQGQKSRFRNWLWAITRNVVRQFYRDAQGKPQAIGGSSAAAALRQVPEMLNRASEPSEVNSRRALVHRALRLIEGDFTPPCWQAFWRTTIEGEPAAQTAEDLGLSPAAVRQAKYRVLCRLRDELQEF